MNLTIYLAGPMDCISDSEMKGWREVCHEYFKSIEGVTILDPTRRPHENELTPTEIMLLDLKDIDRSDMLLVDTRDHGKPRDGTMCEIFKASWYDKKPVIGWYDDKLSPVGKTRIFMDALLTNEFGSLEKALEHVEGNYLV